MTSFCCFYCDDYKQVQRNIRIINLFIFLTVSMYLATDLLWFEVMIPNRLVASIQISNSIQCINFLNVFLRPKDRFNLFLLFYGKSITCLYPAGNYMFKVINRNTRTRCEICQWCRSGVFIVNFEHILHLVLVFLLTMNR